MFRNDTLGIKQFEMNPFDGNMAFFFFNYSISVIMMLYKKTVKISDPQIRSFISEVM